MSKKVIEISGLSKKYTKDKEAVYPQKKSLKDRFTQLFGSRNNGSKNKNTEFWALKDIAFSVNKGDALGIIGPNGAGKTTLLKILSQIAPPTKGRIILRGSVTPLLGVGTGFVKGLSGRENIFLNGSIMGMSKKLIKSKFDEIVEFSGVENFIDMPIKYYSSGMYSRLAFAVATHIVGDILIVDEVLSVGDAGFQKKSLDKMSSLMGSGRTVLFVSHSMNSILKFCNKAIWLDHGKLVSEGDAQSVAEAYLKTVTNLNDSWSDSNERETKKDQKIDQKQSPEDSLKAAAFKSVLIQNNSGERKKIFFRNESIKILLQYEIHKNNAIIVPVLHLYCCPRHGVDADTHILTSYDDDLKNKRDNGDYESKCTIPAYFLNDGEYYISVALVTPGARLLRHEKRNRILTFKVVENFDPEKVVGSVHSGVIRPDLKWNSQ
jgi:lipopolysaccharide transport system ATP-binding protein